MRGSADSKVRGMLSEEDQSRHADATLAKRLFPSSFNIWHVNSSALGHFRILNLPLSPGGSRAICRTSAPTAHQLRSVSAIDTWKSTPILTGAWSPQVVPRTLGRSPASNQQITSKAAKGAKGAQVSCSAKLRSKGLDGWSRAPIGNAPDAPLFLQFVW